MEINDAINLLEHHNKWRRGADIPMVNPTALGEAIDVVVKNYKEKIIFQCIMDDKKEISYAKTLLDALNNDKTNALAKTAI